MARSIKIKASIRDQDTKTEWSTEATATTTNNGQDASRVTTSTSEGSTALAAGTNPRYLWMINRSTTAAETISVGFATGVRNIRLIPGVPVFVALENGKSTLWHQAASGTPSFDYAAYEE